MKCRFCKKTPINEKLQRNCTQVHKGKTYIYYACRQCETARARAYRKTESGKLAIQRAVQRYDANNPERRKVWTQAQKLPLKPCVVCGGKKTHRHHPDIKKPLAVIFLCAFHHKAAHIV